MKKARQKKIGKRGVSEMIAYVILISIAMGLAVGVYAFLKVVSEGTKPPIDCKQGTTISLENYDCKPDEGIITLTIKNTGRFNVNGIIAKFGDDTTKEPVEMLKPYPFLSALLGHFSFDLAPGESKEAKFKKTDAYNPPEGIVRVVQIQPYIMDKRKTVCLGVTIKETIISPECNIIPPTP